MRSALAACNMRLMTSFEKDVERFCKPFDKRVDEYESLLTENRIWVGRTKGIGILTAKEAID